MNSDYIYNHILGDKERSLISIYLIKGKPFEYISNRYGLSRAFIKSNLWEDILNIKMVHLNNKNSAYYEDEMSYGALELSYNFKDLNANEIEAYNNYKEKNTAYYEI